MAFAIAKTITLADGSTRLIVDADVFLDEAPYGEPELTFAHEALHVLTTEREETLSDLRLRNLDRDLQVHEAFVGAAGVAAEEYRVERALWADGWRKTGEHLAEVERVGRIFYNEVRKAVRTYQGDLDVSAVAKATLEAFHAMVTSSAYIAAELGESETPVDEVGLDPELDQLVYGEAWREVLSELQRLPPADLLTRRAELDAIAFEIAVKLEAWLEQIGFLARDEGDGSCYFEIRSPLQWALPGFKIETK